VEAEERNPRESPGGRKRTWRLERYWRSAPSRRSKLGRGTALSAPTDKPIPVASQDQRRQRPSTSIAVSPMLAFGKEPPRDMRPGKAALESASTAATLVLRLRGRTCIRRSVLKGPAATMGLEAGWVI